MNYIVKRTWISNVTVNNNKVCINYIANRAVRNPGPVYNIIYESVIIIYSDVRNPGAVNNII
jgi:hypothetical protein